MRTKQELLPFAVAKLAYPFGLFLLVASERGFIAAPFFAAALSVFFLLGTIVSLVLPAQAKPDSKEGHSYLERVAPNLHIFDIVFVWVAAAVFAIAAIYATFFQIGAFYKGLVALLWIGLALFIALGVLDAIVFGKKSQLRQVLPSHFSALSPVLLGLWPI